MDGAFFCWTRTNSDKHSAMLRGIKETAVCACLGCNSKGIQKTHFPLKNRDVSVYFLTESELIGNSRLMGLDEMLGF